MNTKNLFSALLLLVFPFQASIARSESFSMRSVIYDLTRWPDPQKIPVCFMNRTAVSQEIFDDVVAAIEDEFHEKTSVRFSGFEDCNDSDMLVIGVRVQFNRIYNWTRKNRMSAGGGLSFIGPAKAASCGAGCGDGTMRLDVGISGEYPAFDHPGREFARVQTRASAVHEFGHALGLAHEHARTDAAACRDLAEEIENDGTYVYVGEYDEHSIMNYCRTDNVGSLSEGDKEAIGFLYPEE